MSDFQVGQSEMVSLRKWVEMETRCQGMTLNTPLIAFLELFDSKPIIFNSLSFFWKCTWSRRAM